MGQKGQSLLSHSQLKHENGPGFPGRLRCDVRLCAAAYLPVKSDRMAEMMLLRKPPELSCWVVCCW